MKERLTPFKNQKFECDFCGECCRTRRVPLSIEDVKRISKVRDPQEFLVFFGEKFVLEKREWDNGCVFLKDNKCSIHSIKPKICRLYPVSVFYKPLTENEKGFELEDGTNVYLYVDESCGGVSKGKNLNLKDILKLCLEIKNEMLKTNFRELLKFF